MVRSKEKCTVMIHVSLITGVDIKSNKTVAFNEGETQELCVKISEQSQERERDVIVDLMIIPINETSCKKEFITLNFAFC